MSIRWWNWRADAAVVLDARRPGDHRGRAAASARGHRLAVGERGGRGVGPGGGIAAVRTRGAEVVHPRRQVVERLGDAVPVAELVHDAVQAALGRGAVVAGDVDDERVVELTGLLDGLDDATDLVVGVLDRRAEDLHPAGTDHLVGVGDVVPRRQRRRAWGELGVGRDDPQLLLPRQGPVAERVVAVVELAAVALDELARHPDRRLVAARGVVGDPGLLGMDRLLPRDPGDRLVGHVGLEVVALLRRRRGLQRRAVLPQRRVPLAHARPEEAVEVVGAHAPRPPVERPGDGDLVDRGEVGLADPGRAVPVVVKDLEHRRRAARDVAVVAREPRRDLRHTAHGDLVRVAPGQQRRPRRRAHRRRVEVVEDQPTRRQPVERRRVRRPTERAHVPVAHVVAHDQQHVGRPLRRLQRLGEVGLRVLERDLDPARNSGSGGGSTDRSSEVGSVSRVMALLLRWCSSRL